MASKKNTPTKDNGEKRPPLIIKKNDPGNQVRNNTSRVPDAEDYRGPFSLPTKVLTVSSPRIATMIGHTLSVSRADNIIAGNLLRRGGEGDVNTQKANSLIQSAIDDFGKAINKAHSLLRTPSKQNRKNR